MKYRDHPLIVRVLGLAQTHLREGPHPGAWFQMATIEVGPWLVVAQMKVLDRRHFVASPGGVEIHGSAHCHPLGFDTCPPAATCGEGALFGLSDFGEVEQAWWLDTLAGPMPFSIGDPNVPGGVLRPSYAELFAPDGPLTGPFPEGLVRLYRELTLLDLMPMVFPPGEPHPTLPVRFRPPGVICYADRVLLTAELLSDLDEDELEYLIRGAG